MKKTKEEILEEAYSKIRENQSSEYDVVDPILLDAMQEYADQDKQGLPITEDARKSYEVLPDNLKSVITFEDYLISYKTETIRNLIYRDRNQEKQGWVKCSDRLPEFDTPVLVFCKLYGRAIYTHVFIGEFQGDKFGNWHDGKSLGVLPPTHWMPLPKNPEV